QQAIGARRAKADAAETALLDGFQQQIAAVTGVVPATNPSSTGWMPPKALTTLRYLQTTLVGLERAIDGADAAPTPDARTGLAKIQALIPPVVAAAEKINGEGLAALNTKLKQAGKPALMQ